MTENRKSHGPDQEKKILRPLIIVFLVVYALSFLVSMIFIHPLRVSPPPHGVSFSTAIRLSIYRFLEAAIYLSIGCLVLRLIELIPSRGQFVTGWPRYIRAISYQVFGLAFINIVNAAIVEFTRKSEPVTFWRVFNTLYSPMGTVLLGFCLLGIAIAFEAGARAKQENEPTV